MTTIRRQFQFKTKFSVSGHARPLFLTRSSVLGEVELGVIDPLVHDTHEQFWTPFWTPFEEKQENSIARELLKSSQSGLSFNGILENSYPFIELGVYRTDAPSIKNNINLLKNGESTESCFLYFPIANDEYKLKEAPVIFSYNRFGESFVILFDIRDKKLKELIELVYLGKNPYDFVHDTDNFIFKRIIKDYIDFSYQEEGDERSLDLIIKDKKFEFNLCLNDFSLDSYNVKNHKIDLLKFTQFNYYEYKSVFKLKEYENKPSFLGDLKIKLLEHNKEFYYLIMGKYGEVIKYFTKLDDVLEYIGVNPIEVNDKKYYYYFDKASSYNDENIFNLIEYESPNYEYQIKMSKNEMLFNDIEIFIEKAIENIEIKKQKDQEFEQYLLEKEQEKEKVLNLLSFNKEKTLVLKDSYNVGNCEYGTKNFIKQYFKEGLEEIKIVDLLNHDRIEEIINNKQFLRVVLNKFKEV